MNYIQSPHVLPYQGSKRKIAAKILSCIDYKVEGVFIEPFAGSAAVSLAAICNKKANRYIIADKYKPITDLWELIKYKPMDVYEKYSSIWNEQFGDPKAHFNFIRGEFNVDADPVKFLYLMTRCVKNAIRFNSYGEFNQSSDNRRNGTNPEKMKKSIIEVSSLMDEDVNIINMDYSETLQFVTDKDFLYLDPPWQGTSLSVNKRYAYTLDFERFINFLNELNKKNIPYLLSFDGSCGAKSYGASLPDSLDLAKIDINAGRSSQATLLGKDELTIESLYLSPAFVRRNTKYSVCA